jgi:hypothetical protein
MASAQVNDLAVEHNMWISGLKGMIIHVAVDVNGLTGIAVPITAYFTFSNGVRLRAAFSDYSDVGGNVAVTKRVICPYLYTRLPDVQLFMPYTAFSMAPGTWELVCEVVVWDPTYTTWMQLAGARFGFWFS